jgi:DNA polymerase-1
MPKKEPKNRYMLIDGNALIHRGYHAMPNLSTREGTPTGAVYGFTMILLKALADIKPTHIAVTFDLAGPTFRHVAYEAYKGTRVKADQSLYDQIPKVKEVVRALNIPIYEMEGFEADDLLGTLSCEICKTCKDDCEVFIVTGDLDTLQLVNNCVKIYTMKKGLTETMVYDAKAVRARYGLNPNQMVDYRALKGDPSDNIPGVVGIGEKGAIELIAKYGTLEKLYKAVKGKTAPTDIKPRILELLKDQEAGAMQSRMLSEIKCDVPVEISVPVYEFPKGNFEKIFKLFQELEFKSLIPKLPKVYGSTVEPEQFEVAGTEDPSESFKQIEGQKYQLVDTVEEAETVLQKLMDHKELSLDTESDNINAIDARLVGVGLCCDEGTAYYFPVAVIAKTGLMKQLLESEIKKIGHNIKYDMLVLENSGMMVKNIYFDTMIASYLLNSATRQHNLEAIAFSELGYHMQPIEELIGKGKNQITMDKVDPEKVAFYCGEDVDMTQRLKARFEPELKKEKLSTIFTDIEMPLVEVLASMERAGIKVDSKFINRLAGEAEIEIKDLEQDIYNLTGEEFNINSPKQMKEVLFDKLKIDPVGNRKTKTGLSTAADELEKMADQHPAIRKILEYRELAKLHSTYLLALPSLVNKKTGRIHTSYNQTIAATGRLSSTDPNLQNIPIRGTGMGSRVRQAFVAEKGYKLLSLDYSQIELRIVAHVAQDETMMGIFQREEDIHTKTAMEVFGVPKDEVTADMRRDAKTINFGILYGLSSFGLSNRIGQVNRSEAKDFIEKYFKAYPQVKNYIDATRREVNEKAFVVNQLGRMRKFPEIKSGPWPVRAAAERAAINFPIQSLAADVIKVAMINIQNEIRNSKFEIKMLLQVHDELVFEVREDKVEEYAKKLIPLMEEAIKLSVPVRVEAKAGNNWGEMEKLEVRI